MLVIQNTWSQEPLYSGVPVSDFGSNNNIGSANTSRNIAVGATGSIFIAFANGAQIRLAISLDGGQSFLPSVIIADTDNTSVEPEIAINQSGHVFIAWSENGSIHMVRTPNGGIDYDDEIVFGSDVGTRIHMSAYNENVYIIDVNGRTLYSNSNFGVGSFSGVDTSLMMVYADVLTDQNGVVYTPMDDPNLRLFESVDEGASLTEIDLIPGNEQVFFSSYALSDGPCGTYIFVGGGLFEDFGGSATFGYRIDVTTGESTALTMGENLSREGRTLYADNQGTLIDGYKREDDDEPGDLVMRISTDQGNTFEDPIVIATGHSHNIARSPATDNILVVYEAYGEIFLTVYNDVLKNIELEQPDPPLSFCDTTSFDLNFTLSGVFGAGTVFTVQLSDEFGSFANSTQIGSITTGGSGTVTCTLPDDMALSDLYRIQIESFNNCLQSNTIPLIFTEVEVDGPTSVCVGDTIRILGSDTPSATDPWTSSDPSVATVDDDGIVTGISPGIADITFANSQGCEATIRVEVQNFPIVTPLVLLQQCDDDTDGVVAFNLFESASSISDNFMEETFVFYPSLLDAQNDTDAIATSDALAYSNTGPTETLGVRTISSVGCISFSEIQLTVSVSQISSPSALDRIVLACDDFLDIDGNDTVNNDDTDGISFFNFEFVRTEVIQSFPPSQWPFLEVEFYTSEEDAISELNAIADPSNYRNSSSPFTQTIYVRVDNILNNDCVGYAPLITLQIEQAPIFNAVDNLILCDNDDDGDPRNGIVQTFDLSTQTSTILGSQDPTIHSVSYFTSLSDARENINEIVDSTSFENTVPDAQTIYVRIDNSVTGCFSVQGTFEVIVNAWPQVNEAPDLEVCDDNTDGSAQNGFAQSFNLELQTPFILGDQDPDQFVVTYHATLADAELGVLPLGSPFSNSVPFTQTVYVRISDIITNCASDVSSFNAVVTPEPSTENVSNLSYCDDATDGDDTDGFVQNIDLDSQIEDILGPDQLPEDYTVTFHSSQEDATSGENPLTTPHTNLVPYQETIYVRVQNNATGCVNDDFTFDVIVNPLPDFSVTSPQIICLNQLPKRLSIENPSTVYDYVWEDESGNMYVGPDINITSGGTYTVTATTTDGTECSRTRQIVVNESNIAVITESDVTIVDNSDNNSISIDPTNLGIGDYEFALKEENGDQTLFQDDPFFDNLEGGVYTILVRDKNGCGTTSTLVVPVIEFPKFFTPNNDLQNDTWSIKGARSMFFPNASVTIFNRFGKLIATVQIDGPGWDGTYNSEPLPSDDYWFSVSMTDAQGNVRQHQGNFSLLRN